MMNDIRHTLRVLRSSPGFTAVAILSLALGIGLNTAIFSVVDGVLLRPAPLAGIDRLVMIWETDRDTGTTREPASYPDFLDFRERSHSVEAIVAIMADERNLTPPSGDPVRLAALRITSGVLPLLGVTPVLGRSFTEEESDPRRSPVAIISASLWQRLFNSDPQVIGQTIRLDDVPHEIVGIAPDATDFGVLQILTQAAYARTFADRGIAMRVDVWTPLRATPESLPRSTHPIFTLGRLAPEATVVQAQTELAQIAADLERAYPENEARGVNVEPLSAVIFGPVRPALIVLWAGVALVLLVACANVANLLLARGTARRREIAIRTALGSGTSRLARQFAIETLVLTGIAASVGVAFAYVTLEVLLTQAPPDVPRLSDVAIDLRVLGATTTTAILVGLAFGLVPTLQALGVNPEVMLKGEPGRSTAGSRAGAHFRRALVVAELALAVVLVVSAGLLLRSFWELQQVDTGFQSAGVIKAEYQLPLSRYFVGDSFPDFPKANAFTEQLLSRVRSLPGVESAAVAGNHPLDPGFTNSFSIVGRQDDNLPEISYRRVTPGYFETAGVRLVRGRRFDETDATSAPAVSIINEAAATRFFAGADPLGQKIRMRGADRTIVGVVADERFQGIGEPAPIALYLPVSQAISPSGVLLVRGGNAASLMAEVRGVFREIDPGLAVFGLEPLDATVSRSIAEQRFTTTLLAFFALVALVLGAIGVHGVLSYGVARRTQEIGIRIALGAEPRHVHRQVVGEALALTALGVTLGLAGALSLGALLRALLFGISAADPWTYAAVSLLLLLVAWAASLMPARRATAVDPVEAMRV